MDSTKIILCGDGSFGPVVENGCRGGFDFTVQFEELVLAILPTAIFLLFSPFRALALFRRRIIARRNRLYVAKLVTIGAYIGLQLALLVQWAQPELRSSVSIASTTLSLASGLSLALLSHLEHAKSIRPSFTITFYLVVTALLDIARARTQWLVTHADGVAGTLTASLAVKVTLLILEAIEKRRILLGSGREYAPESTSGPLSRGFFLWLNALLLSGFGKVLLLADLPSISEKLESKVLSKDLSKTWDECNQKRKHALAVATVLTFRWEVFLIVFPKLAYVALSLSQPFLIQEAVGFVQSTGTSENSNLGYGLIGGFALVYIGLAITLGWSSHLTYRLMTMIRGGLVSIIYRKMLQTQATKLNDSAATTLMGTDVQRIAETFHYLLVETIPAFIQLAIATYLLYLQLGAVFVVLLILSVAGTLLSGQIADKVSTSQRTWLEAIQTRINFTSEILGSMKNVKMLGLSGQMFNMIEALRHDEIEKSKKYRRVQAYNASIGNVPEIISKLLLFGAYAIIAHINGTDSLSVSQAISSLALIFLVSKPLATILFAIPQGWSALGCFQRIQSFLNDTPVIKMKDASYLACCHDDVGTELGPIQSEPQGGNIVLENASFGWSQSSQDIVSNVTVRISAPETGLTILTGPVGCGKSTLLKGILRETPHYQGQIAALSSRVAFCDQTPWIMSGSIRANIVAESEYDEAWYQSVVGACALDIDIARLSHGDLTVVGSKGVKLSGGQKQRISIARAVYSRKPIAILDDVLSGLDAVTEEAVFRGVFGPNGLFKKISATVILATHSVKRLPEADMILAMDGSGKIVEQGRFSDLNVPGSYVHSLNISMPQSATETDDDYLPGREKGTGSHEAPTETRDQDLSRQTGDWATYKYYAAALGRSKLLVFVAFVVLNEAANGIQSIWLNWWAQNNEQGGPPRLGYWLGIFAVFSVAEAVGLIASIAYLYVHITPNGGRHLHSSILKAALDAPMSFLAQIETGMLVNRFSQDLRLADMTLPGAIINIAFQLGQCIVATVLAATAVGYFAAVVPPAIFVLYLIQRFYLRTSRQLRLLELETSAPLFSHFIESLNGLVTIRAFGWTEEYTDKTNRLLDESQKPFYLLLCIQRWLVLVLDLVVAGLAILLVSLAVALRTKINPGLLGIALVQLTSLSHALTALVQFWTLLETSLGAISRIKDFSDTTPRETTAEELSEPPPYWPSRGALAFDSVSAGYEIGGPLILKNLSFSLQGGQKIGIVGRTGSGKSSTVQAILKMIDITHGRILVDDVDLATLAGSVVREHITTLTQDPFLFPSSIRSNIDPRGVVTDEEISDALDKVKLWDLLKGRAKGDTPDVKAVLDTPVDEDLLSHGQRQLFCLARALLKPGKVLILDEPTSSVDPKTDAQMQEIIRAEFKDHTILMIAHRLSSLLDFDLVLVLDQGSLAESGRPEDLLTDPSSRFTRMYQGSGHVKKQERDKGS
ncbi:P-loop containing nucleoside triphosphate hydrolase protein [Xylaria palmicola]|nr:P-loop containing nucleoside triphosphate hydrolase protein [Xylaria palmicola]